MQRGSSSLSSKATYEVPMERPWDFTAATPGQVAGTVALGGANLAGVAVLSSMLASASARYALAAQVRGGVDGDVCYVMGLGVSGGGVGGGGGVACWPATRIVLCRWARLNEPPINPHQARSGVLRCHPSPGVMMMVLMHVLHACVPWLQGLGFIGGLLPAFQIYAAMFFAIPAARWVWHSPAAQRLPPATCPRGLP